LLQAFLDHRFERRAEEFGHQVRRRVIGAGGFALGARRKRKGALGDEGLMVQEALVDGAQLLHIKHGVVDSAPGVGFVVLVIGQVEERLQEVPIGEGALLQLHPLKKPSIQDREAQETC